ncbi:flagellar type III secretion system pore protein FliP [Vibrio owensii]|uniref:flagellar type III secretion system pore protein FliP n=1 Tax=Vibrio owensii TaxID=696485 RepID=UPI0018F1B2DB|nr:flagellar type III secretion system pore protein FliP [Vibrio owensii]
MKNVLKPLLLIGLLGATPLAYAESGMMNLVTITGGEGAQSYSTKLEILILMTLLGFVPSLVIMCTCFTRIIIVLSLLRQALGLQQSPPNQVLIGIALIFTVLIMRPVGERMYEQAYLPYSTGQINVMEALELAEKPLREYMIAQTELTTYDKVLEIAEEPSTLKIEDAPFLLVLPAYLLSELKAAFQIGFMIFLPFLAIDLIVASVLMAMGMMMLSPLIVSLPFKLMLFVSLDGWSLIMSSLSSTFWINT